MLYGTIFWNLYIWGSLMFLYGPWLLWDLTINYTFVRVSHLITMLLMPYLKCLSSYLLASFSKLIQAIVAILTNFKIQFSFRHPLTPVYQSYGICLKIFCIKKLVHAFAIRGLLACLSYQFPLSMSFLSSSRLAKICGLYISGVLWHYFLLVQVYSVFLWSISDSQFDGA